MSVTITLTPAQETRLEQEARKSGITVDELVLRTLQEKFPLEADEDVKALQLIEQWLLEAPKTLEDKRAAEADLTTFQQALNQTRRDAGARVLYPEAR
ncbi:hypothetical protein [Armatimonas sp.]|uniref:hypothetical protein n=1 Tax=Armatimonas sp. TaxID=1872638 RepID=UPI00374D29AC